MQTELRVLKKTKHRQSDERIASNSKSHTTRKNSVKELMQSTILNYMEAFSNIRKSPKFNLRTRERDNESKLMSKTEIKKKGNISIEEKPREQVPIPIQREKRTNTIQSINQLTEDFNKIKSKVDVIDRTKVRRANKLNNNKENIDSDTSTLASKNLGDIAKPFKEQLAKFINKAHYEDIICCKEDYTTPHFTHEHTETKSLSKDIVLTTCNDTNSMEIIKAQTLKNNHLIEAIDEPEHKALTDRKGKLEEKTEEVMKEILLKCINKETTQDKKHTHKNKLKINTSCELEQPLSTLKNSISKHNLSTFETKINTPSFGSLGKENTFKF